VTRPRTSTGHAGTDYLQVLQPPFAFGFLASFAGAFLAIFWFLLGARLLRIPGFFWVSREMSSQDRLQGGVEDRGLKAED
jgi:hypothetical protein